MYFDPLSAWLVALIADGTVASGGRRNGSTSEHHQKYIKLSNETLNQDIRRLRQASGLTSPETTYDQIKLLVQQTRNDPSFQCAHGHIIIAQDNQEYIINLLEACSKWYSKYPDAESKNKANRYKRAAKEAREIAKNLEETRLREEAKEKRTTLIFLVAAIISVILIIIRLNT